jgi:hypothetical protein
MAWNAEDIELFRLKLLDSLLDIFCLPRRDHYCRTLAGVCVCVCVCVFEREREREREKGERSMCDWESMNNRTYSSPLSLSLQSHILHEFEVLHEMNSKSARWAFSWRIVIKELFFWLPYRPRRRAMARPIPAVDAVTRHTCGKRARGGGELQ